MVPPDADRSAVALGAGQPAGSRNGRQPPAAVKTTMGPVELVAPELWKPMTFTPRRFGTSVTRTNAFETLVTSGWVRGA